MNKPSSSPKAKNRKDLAKNFGTTAALATALFVAEPNFAHAQDTTPKVQTEVVINEALYDTTKISIQNDIIAKIPAEWKKGSEFNTWANMSIFTHRANVEYLSQYFPPIQKLQTFFPDLNIDQCLLDLKKKGDLEIISFLMTLQKIETDKELSEEMKRRIQIQLLGVKGFGPQNYKILREAGYDKYFRKIQLYNVVQSSKMYDAFRDFYALNKESIEKEIADTEKSTKEKEEFGFLLDQISKGLGALK